MWYSEKYNINKNNFHVNFLYLVTNIQKKNVFTMKIRNKNKKHFNEIKITQQNDNKDDDDDDNNKMNFKQKIILINR